jgi:hypothetical protein
MGGAGFLRSAVVNGGQKAACSEKAATQRRNLRALFAACRKIGRTIDIAVVRLVLLRGHPDHETDENNDGHDKLR